MQVKEIWTDKNFKEMDWHDATIHFINFPQYEPTVSFDIDYIFEWILNKDTNLFNFYVSPCTLTFYNVLYLKIEIDFQNSIGIFIDTIKKIPIQDSNDNFFHIIIKTDKGDISFKSNKFEQMVKKQPAFSESYSLKR